MPKRTAMAAMKVSSSTSRTSMSPTVTAGTMTYPVNAIRLEDECEYWTEGSMVTLYLGVSTPLCSKIALTSSSGCGRRSRAGAVAAGVGGVILDSSRRGCRSLRERRYSRDAEHCDQQEGQGEPDPQRGGTARRSWKHPRPLSNRIDRLTGTGPFFAILSGSRSFVKDYLQPTGGIGSVADSGSRRGCFPGTPRGRSTPR